MSKTHYGLNVGDKVKHVYGAFSGTGKVVELAKLDNNRVYVELENGEVIPAVAEWLRKV